jgi:hypothetical protein
MRRLLGVLLVLALLGSGAASASHRDPERRLTPADQALARSLLLRRGDLGIGYRTIPSGPPGHLDCAALDESDLTLTGEARSATWARDITLVASYANVYRSAANANASFQRSASAAGRRCVARALQRDLGSGGARVLPIRQISFPRVAPRTSAFRVVLEPAAGGPAITIDLIVLQRSRAQAFFYVGSLGVPPVKAEEVRLARIVAARLAKGTRSG